MATLLAILSKIGSFIGSIISSVITEALKTPAKETSVENVEGSNDIEGTSTDELNNQYKWMHNRNQGED